MNTPRKSHDTLQDAELAIRQALKGLCYGSVEIVLHDSKIVQIERKEKFRFESTPSRPARLP